MIDLQKRILQRLREQTIQLIIEKEIHAKMTVRVKE